MVVFLGDDAAVGVAVFHVDVADHVILGDDGAGVDDVDHEVVDVLAVGAGEIGANFAAFAVEGVALHAGFAEEGSACDGVAGLERFGGEDGFVFGDLGELILAGGFGNAPDLVGPGVDLFIAETSELADGVGGQVLAWGFCCP